MLSPAPPTQKNNGSFPVVPVVLSLQRNRISSVSPMSFGGASTPPPPVLRYHVCVPPARTAPAPEMRTQFPPSLPEPVVVTLSVACLLLN